MQNPPLLTDNKALALHRARATAFFLQQLAVAEVQERLSEVNRTFTAPLVVTPFPHLWPEMPCILDTEILPVAVAAHDLIIHAISLHWANDLVGQLVQCRRALKADGLFIGVLFGGQTLHELRACLAQAETEITSGLSPRVLPMAEIRDLGSLLQRAGFALPVADSFTKTVLYRDIWHLMQDLRSMGEANALAARLKQPTKRAIFSRAADLYQKTYTTQQDKISATFEIICLTGWATHADQQKPLRPGSASARLADILGATETSLARNGG